jgi:uncharacterized protein (DUF4415 family)
MQAKTGDKVRLKTNGSPDVRGVVERAAGDTLVVRVNETQDLVRVAADAVVNFSLAARKAWKSMPDRRVGRPKGTRLCDRVSVTLRIDRELWERFQLDESQGLIEDRTATINKWLREKLEALEQTGRRT